MANLRADDRWSKLAGKKLPALRTIFLSLITEIVYSRSGVEGEETILSPIAKRFRIRESVRGDGDRGGRSTQPAHHQPHTGGTGLPSQR